MAASPVTHVRHFFQQTLTPVDASANTSIGESFGRDIALGRNAADEVMQVVRELAGAVSWHGTQRVFDVLGLLVLFRVVAKTCVYVMRRKKGLVGPAMATVLIKFWAIYGLLEFAAYLLALYLTPLKGVWILSIAKTVALVVLARGRRLDFAVQMYEKYLAPFYRTHEPELERRLAAARADWDEFDEALRQLATQLLKRIAVGGLTGLLTGEGAESTEDASTTGNTSGHPRRGQEQRRGLPFGERPEFSSGKQFFAGTAQERANAARDASSGDLSSFHVQAADVPKSRYDEFRSLRRKYSRRGSQTSTPREN